MPSTLLCPFVMQSPYNPSHRTDRTVIVLCGEETGSPGPCIWGVWRLSDSTVQLFLWPRAGSLAPSFPQIRDSHKTSLPSRSLPQDLATPQATLWLFARTIVLPCLSWAQARRHRLTSPARSLGQSYWLCLYHHPTAQFPWRFQPCLFSVKATHLPRAAEIAKVRAKPPFSQERRKHLMLSSRPCY